MHVLLTGGTGFVGSSVLDALLDSGHTVFAPARSAESAQKLSRDGVTVELGDLTDRERMTDWLRACDAAIHVASPNDATSATFDDAIVDAVVSAYEHSGKPYLHTGGLWVWGPSRKIVEDAPLAPPRISRWRIAVEDRLLREDVHALIVCPGTVYARGGGGLTRLATRRVTDHGQVQLIGDGSQRWSLIDRDDLGRLYAIALESGLTGRLIGTSGEVLSVRAMGELAAQGRGVAGEPPEETSARFGAALAEALLMDQVADPQLARSLGWKPRQPTFASLLGSA